MIRKTVIYSVVTTGIVLLSGCGGGGGASSPAAAPTPAAGVTGYNQLVAEQKAITTRYFSGVSNVSDVSKSVTPVAAMPTKGQLSYSGTAAIGPLDDVNYARAPAMGRFTATADLNNGKLNGTIKDFRAAPGAPRVSGRVTIAAKINRNSASGTHTGRVTYAGKTSSVSGNYKAAFLGRQAKGIFGTGEGTGRATGRYEFVTIGSSD